MSKTDKKILFILILPLLALILNIIYGKVLNQYIYIGFWSIILVILGITTGFRKDKSIYKKDTMQQIFIYAFIYLIFIYGCGVFVGFLKSLNSFTILNIIKNILPVAIEIIIIEYIRYTIISRDVLFVNKILLIIVLVLFDVVLSLNKYNILSSIELLKLICCVILPSAAKQIFLIYLVKIGGFKPSILYCFITELYIYIIPIIPDFGEYMNDVIKVIVPLLLLLRFRKLYTKEKQEVVRSNRFKHSFLIVFLILIIGINIYLTSDLFLFRALTVGSSSMEPKLMIGDAIILKKTTTYEDLEVGDILIFKHEQKIMIHRIIDITEKDNHYSFKTKGDNNNTADDYITNEDDVIGKYLFKIPLIGYPSVWLSEVLK